jgi:hypothetical protein
MRTPGGLIIHLRLNGASSKSICGGNWRQSKMSLAFWQICNDFKLATFSNRIDPKRTPIVAAWFSRHRHFLFWPKMTEHWPLGHPPIGLACELCLSPTAS